MKTVKQYRERANFLRKMAAEAKLESLRDSYLNLALDWDNMADMAEGIHAGKVGKSRAANN